MDKPLIEFVLEELEKRKGSWPQISRDMEPDAWEAHYSWMSKVSSGAIPDPGVHRVQALADYFRAENRKAKAA